MQFNTDNVEITKIYNVQHCCNYQFEIALSITAERYENFPSKKNIYRNQNRRPSTKSYIFGSYKYSHVTHSIARSHNKKIYIYKSQMKMINKLLGNREEFLYALT